MMSNDKDSNQKKLLWVAAAVGVFLLIVIGTALILYSPSKTSGTTIALTGDSSGTNLSNTGVNADPDAWVRNPDTTPQFDSKASAQEPAGSISDYMIVSGNTTVITDKTTIDLIGTNPTNKTESIPLTDILPAEKTETKPVTQSVTQKPATTTQSTKALTPDSSSTAKAQTTKPATTVKPTTTVTEYWIQAASFASKGNAEKARTVLSNNKINSEIFTASVNDATHYRVRVGPYKTKNEADYWLTLIKEQSEFSESYVTEVKAQR